MKVVEGEIVRPGPESKYSPEACDKIIKIAAQGGHIPAMCLAAGCRSKDTWYRWQDEHPEFKEAVEMAKLVSQAFYESIGLKGMLGEIKDFNSTIFAMVMNNKFREDYSRGTGNNTEVTINNNTLNLTSEQIKDRIAQTMEKLQSLGENIVSPAKAN